MKKILKNVMSWLLLIVYLVGNPTTMVYAEMISTNPDDAVSSVTVGSTTNEGDIEVTKSVEPKRDNDGSIIPGEYTINFDIKGKSTTHSDTYPIYTVVVFDHSRSMIEGENGETKWANAKAGAIKYSQVLKEASDANQFALVIFSDYSQTQRGFTNALIPENLLGYPAGGTMVSYALKDADKLLDKAPSNAKKVVLLISDGEAQDASKYLFKNIPSASELTENTVLENQDLLKTIKSKAEVYTIGYALDELANPTAAKAYLKNIASNPSNYVNATIDGEDGLVKKIQELATEISKQPAATGASITEVPASEFSLADNETSTKVLKDIDENTQRISYDI